VFYIVSCVDGCGGRDSLGCVHGGVLCRRGGRGAVLCQHLVDDALNGLFDVDVSHNVARLLVRFPW